MTKNDRFKPERARSASYAQVPPPGVEAAPTISAGGSAAGFLPTRQPWRRSQRDQEQSHARCPDQMGAAADESYYQAEHADNCQPVTHCVRRRQDAGLVALPDPAGPVSSRPPSVSSGLAALGSFPVAAAATENVTDRFGHQPLDASHPTRRLSPPDYARDHNRCQNQRGNRKNRRKVRLNDEGAVVHHPHGSDPGPTPMAACCWYLSSMDAKDVAAMTAEALNSLENRIDERLDGIDRRLDGIDGHLDSIVSTLARPSRRAHSVMVHAVT